MAQYYKVLSQPDDNVEKVDQFYENNQNKEIRQIQYIFADEQKFQAHNTQLVQLSKDQIMVVDRPQQQQQIQNVVIDQGQLTYQSADQTQFNNVVEQPTQQIYFMEATTGTACNTNNVHRVINQIPQPRQVTTPIRQNLSAIRTPQQQMQTPQQTPQIRLRAPMQQQQLPLRQIVQQEALRQQTKTIPMSALMNRSLQALQQKQQNPRDAVEVLLSVPQQPQTVVKDSKDAFDELRDSVTYTNNQVNNSTEDIKNVTEDENDEGDSFNQTTNPVIQYRKLMDHKNQIPKNTGFLRLPNNFRIAAPNNGAGQQVYLRQPLHQTTRPKQPGTTELVQSNQVANQNDLGHTNDSKIGKFVQKGKTQSYVNVTNRPRMQRPAGIQSANPTTRFIQQNQPQKITQQLLQQQQRMAQSESHIVQGQSPIQRIPQQQQQAQAQPRTFTESQMRYVITPPGFNRPKQPLPPFIHASQIQRIIAMFQNSAKDDQSDSIRMLVFLENGEQRLITFTLPREACTIHEVLEQVNVSFTPETHIQVIETHATYLNYIVTVGNVTHLSCVCNDDEDGPETGGGGSSGGENNVAQLNQNSNEIDDGSVKNQDKTLYELAPVVDGNNSSCDEQQQQQIVAIAEQPKELPKLIPGKLAVCPYCGYTGEDFNRCRRCNRKLADNIRSIDVSAKKINVYKSVSDSNIARLTTPVTRLSSVSAVNSSIAKKKLVKAKTFELESVVISSDEEDNDNTSSKRVSEDLLKSLGASVTISPVTKEPTLNDIKKHVRKNTQEISKNYYEMSPKKLSVKCRTVRIGSYRSIPLSEIYIDSRCVLIRIAVKDSKNAYETIKIDNCDIVKVLICFNKELPVIFYYLNAAAAPPICELLNLKRESGAYFDPTEENEDSYRKITLLPDDLYEDQRIMFKQIYDNLLEELNSKEANDILVKSCPKELQASAMSFTDIKQILLYPKEGQGRLSINTEDYVCLAVDQFLNDKIIDFYLKYLWENLPSEKQEKVHVFSTFFYKRLTTKPTKAAKKSHPFESDPTLSAAEKRHCRVKNWTKRINLFEKDFIVVPINENAHWFLAIICFPGMTGAQTFDGKPYNPEPKPKKIAKNKAKKEKPIPCDDPLISDKDEAESEESDMESDDSEESPVPATVAPTVVANLTPALVARGKKVARPPIKQSCILIFDSLAGPSRSRVVATLRDYLTVEFKTKMDSERIYNRDIIKGASVKVPQQTNFTDCGLYLLQYVEQFFTDGIKDYHIPLKGIENWFDEMTVTRKREDICNLIKKLMAEAGSDITTLPDITLPTLNGSLVERTGYELEPDGETGEEQEDMFTDIEDSELLNTSISENDQSQIDKGEEESDSKSTPSSVKPSPSPQDDSNKTVPADVLKHTFAEFPRQSNKETLSYLKSKRIVRSRPKIDSETDIKKFKFE